MEFQTRTYAKWILTGEHSVLRGVPALVFPVKEKFMDFHFTESGYSPRAEFKGEHGEELKLLFWGVLEDAANKMNIPRTDLHGNYFIQSNVPIGAGLGASALLCVAIARWLLWKNWISEERLFSFAKELENNFHGESSGVDIAGVLEGYGTHYEIGRSRYRLEINWEPLWYLSYSGQRAVTSDCVNKVKALYARDFKLEAELDGFMKQASKKAEQALKMDEKYGLPLLSEAISDAESCFERWGLIEGSLKEHIQNLKSQGALAVKPTGSGGGGYVLSLWDKTPPPEIRKKMIC